MTMKPLKNWRAVLRHAWSVRWMGLWLGLKLLSECVPYLSDIFPWWLSVGIIVAAFTSRFVHQKPLSGEDDEEEEPLGI
jgi:hypothetical protein